MHKLLEILFAGEICNFISLYRSPSQSHDVFETFADKNPYLIAILGDFNAKSTNWCKHDKTTYEGSKIEAITSVWIKTVHSGTNPYFIKLVFLH